MKPIAAIVSVLLTLVALAHLLRFIQAWTITIDTVYIPGWVSLVSFFIIGLLAVLLWIEAKRH